MLCWIQGAATLKQWRKANRLRHWCIVGKGKVWRKPRA